MKPPESQGPEYDRGYADGYRDRVIDLLVWNLANVETDSRLKIKEILFTQGDQCSESAQ